MWKLDSMTMIDLKKGGGGGNLSVKNETCSKVGGYTA
jgi:hypothetical protein